MASPDMDATKLLAEDHRKVEGLFEKYEKAKGVERKQALVEEICTELKIHSMIEEEIFYSALRGKIEEDVLDEAIVEHDAAKLLINDLLAAEPDEEFYDAKVKVLKEEIEHHVYEEERQNNSMFAQARKSDVDLQALGTQLKTRKEDLMGQAETSGLPPAQTTAMEGGEGVRPRH
jgi:hypothetical protein